KRAGGRAPAEVPLDRARNNFQIVRHLPLRMAGGVVARVPAMIPQVEHEQVEIAQQAGPEWKIAVDGKAIPVRPEEPRAPRVAVPAHAHDRAIGHRKLDDGAWLREAKRHWPNIQNWGPAAPPE